MFNFFRKKNFQNTLGEKYSELIFQIVSLGENYEQKFHVVTEVLDEKTFAIIIDFSGKINSTVAYCDTFVLMEKSNGLSIEWKRHSNSLFAFLPSILPERVKHLFTFEKNQAQDKIFNALLNGIIHFLNNNYEFSDTHYEDVAESGHSKFYSQEELAKRDIEFMNEEMDWNINESNKMNE